LIEHRAFFEPPEHARKKRARSVVCRAVSGLRAAIALCLALACLVGAQAAHASAPIEGVWSFNGGNVAIQREAGGTYTGTVVAATRFAECSHPIGEAMWTEMRLQGDGSYWGLHQWFFEGAACVLNPQRGPTAWRVIETHGGGRFLRACFSAPGASQPTISSSGATANVSYGCVDSALVAPPPRSGTEALKEAVSLPGTRRCYSHRAFTIHMKDPRNDPLKEVLLTLGRHKLRVKRHGNLFTSRVDLRGLPKGAFTVRIRLTTVLGHRFSTSRTYHTCTHRRGPAKRGRSSR
jgi:hypothetical protein